MNLRALLTTLALSVIPALASAQNYPTKPIRLVVPFPRPAQPTSCRANWHVSCRNA